MRIFQNELILNHITVGEYYPLYRAEFESYQKCATILLASKNRHLFESDILKLYGEGVTLDTILNQNKHRFIEGPELLNNGKPEPTWYDIWGTDEIRRADELFDFFFASKLRHLNPYHLDEFLDFHLAYSFENKKSDYLRFLQIMLRQYQQVYEKYPADVHIPGVVREWMEIAQTRSEEGKQETTDKKIKGRLPRQPKDNLTCLSQVQTAMLIGYMQEAGLILNDKILNDKQAGTAFNLLTGFSIDSLRLKIGKNGSLENTVKHEDYNDLYDAIMKMAKLIEPKIRHK